MSGPARARRRYDGALRRLRAAQTRERIVAAGSEILRDSPIRDWHAVTIRAVAAAMLDVLWSVATYERLVADWHFDRQQAIRGIGWVIGLVEEAIRSGRRPGRPRLRAAGRPA